MQKFLPINYSSLHTNSLRELHVRIESVGSVKIHFDARSNHLSSNNRTMPRINLFQETLL